MNNIMEQNIMVNIQAIPAFNDNYIWALTHKNNALKPELNGVALVDPGDAKACIDYIEKNGLKLTDILITHHHADHVGGIEALLGYAKNANWQVTVYGPKNEKIPCCDVKLVENDTVTLADLDVSYTVQDLPGHTLGHISYFNNQAVFCGDTLFSGGCGRVFEGTFEQMHTALNKLSRLPESTLVYCAHEYTQANLNFALAVDKDNTALNQYANEVQQLRNANKATIPTSIGREKAINPFLRCHTSSVQNSAKVFDNKELVNTLETFSAIRRWKDQF